MATQATAIQTTGATGEGQDSGLTRKITAKLLRSALKLGKPNQCYDNSMRAVWKMPGRLKYVEGFEITEHNNGYIHFNHHAQVLDTVTGIVHEVTPFHATPNDYAKNQRYVYREYWRHELGVNGPTDDPDMKLYIPNSEIQNYDPNGYNDTYSQLTLQEQHELLAEAGYKLELWVVREDSEKFEVNYEERQVELTDENRWHTSYFDDEMRDKENEAFEKFLARTNYQYEWRVKEVKVIAGKVQAKNRQKAVKCWFVTKDEPTADQRDAINRRYGQVPGAAAEIRGLLTSAVPQLLLFHIGSRHER